MNLILPYKVPKNQEIFKRALELEFKVLSDLGEVGLNNSIFLGYIIDLIEDPKKYRHSQILYSNIHKHLSECPQISNLCKNLKTSKNKNEALENIHPSKLMDELITLTPIVFDIKLQGFNQIWKFCKQFSCRLWLLQENMQELIINCDNFGTGPRVNLQIVRKMNKETYILFTNPKKKCNLYEALEDWSNIVVKNWLLARIFILKQKIFSSKNSEYIVTGELSYVEQGLFTKKLSQYTNLPIIYKKNSQFFQKECVPELNSEKLIENNKAEEVNEYPGAPQLPNSSSFFPKISNLALPQVPTTYQTTPNPIQSKNFSNFESPQGQGIFEPSLSLPQLENYSITGSYPNYNTQEYTTKLSTGKFDSNPYMVSEQVQPKNNEKPNRSLPPPRLLKKGDASEKTLPTKNSNLSISSPQVFNFPAPNLNLKTRSPEDDIKSSVNIKASSNEPSEHVDMRKSDKSPVEMTFNSKYNSINASEISQENFIKSESLAQSLPLISTEQNFSNPKPSINSEPLNPPHEDSKNFEKSSIMNPIIINANTENQEQPKKDNTDSKVGPPLFIPKQSGAPQSYFSQLSPLNVNNLFNPTSEQNHPIVLTVKNTNPNYNTLPAIKPKTNDSFIPQFFDKNNTVSLPKPEKIIEPPSFNSSVIPPVNALKNPEELKQSIPYTYDDLNAASYSENPKNSFGTNCPDCNFIENEPYFNLTCGCFNCQSCIQISLFTKFCENCKSPLQNIEIQNLSLIFQDQL